MRQTVETDMHLHLVIIRIITLIICLLCGISGLLAQNNPYKIDDELYKYYKKAFGLRHQPVSLAMADTLFDMAEKKGDAKAQCMALVIPTNYYFNRKDEEQLHEAVEKCKEFALKSGYTQYYYHAFSLEIGNLLNIGKHIKAIKMAEELKTDVLKRDDKYGFFCCLRTMGNIYLIRNEFFLAIQTFETALAYMQKHLPEQDEATIASTLARACFADWRFKEAREYASLAMQKGKTEKVILEAQCIFASSLYLEEKYEEFKAFYDQHLKELKPSTAIVESCRTAAFRCLVDSNYQKAYQMADLLKERGEWKSLTQIILQHQGKYKEALELARTYQRHRDSTHTVIQIRDVAEFNSELNNEQLKREAQALQLANTQLSLKNTQLSLSNTQLDLQNAQLRLRYAELGMTELRTKAQLDSTRAERNALALQKRNMELAQLLALSRQQKLINNGIFLFILVLGMGVAIYIFQRKRAERLLKIKNYELKMARERAEESERMKTLFMQNMSHEIRTPLNSIVGFSELLSTPGLELENEEREEYSKLIKHNSALLTTLINDVLDLSSLESGKYTLHPTLTRINELCKQSISTVLHRVPHGVKLYFTTELADDFTLNVDADRLQQVIVNYLTNAEKHTEQGEIHLHASLTENPNRLTFSVTDTGCGIPIKDQEHLFERFNKLNNFKQGTGLGLNICRLIAQRMNGEAKIDPSYTHGARFLFIIPMEENGAYGKLPGKKK